MTLQTSPVLSTPHFILLHTLYCSCATPAAGDDEGKEKKNLAIAFPREESNQGSGKSIFPHTRAGITQNTAGIFTARVGFI